MAANNDGLGIFNNRPLYFELRLMLRAEPLYTEWAQSCSVHLTYGAARHV
jgi:hypothetical protein